MREGHEFTAAEAAFVLREPIRAVKKALDEGPVQAKLIVRPSGRVRAIDEADLLYLFAVQALRDELTPRGRGEFYQALKATPVKGAHEVRFGRFSVAIGDFKVEIAERARELAALAEKVEFRPDGEPVLKVTGVEVHRIAALLDGGLTPEEVCKEYPSLDLEAVAVARAYADAYPKPGRPYPRTTAKQALKGIGLEALDEILNREV